MITKGPWLVSSSVIVVTKEAKIIANCMPVGVPELEIGIEEAIDNTKLISAAPDLLRACEIMAARFCNADIQNETVAEFMSDGGMKEMVAAISKACD